MEKKKKIIYLLFPLIGAAILFVGYFSYMMILKPCTGDGWPIPPPSLYFGSYYMVTDQGRLYMGQTYEHRNEGSWVGSLTLLLLNGRGATFLIRAPQGTGSDFRIVECKLYYPRTLENIDR
jgi:hypothetical protein